MGFQFDPHGCHRESVSPLRNIFLTPAIATEHREPTHFLNSVMCILYVLILLK